MQRVVILSVVMGCGAACHHASSPPVQGSSVFQFVEPVAAPVVADPKPATQGNAPVETLLVAAPIEPLAKPSYPRAVLGRETRPVIVGVRIIVDATGRVASAQPSRLVLSSLTPHLDEFRAAVDDALAHWRFRPAELRRLVPIADAKGAPAWALVSREKTDYACDVSFVFHATGEVAAGLK